MPRPPNSRYVHPKKKFVEEYRSFSLNYSWYQIAYRVAQKLSDARCFHVLPPVWSDFCTTRYDFETPVCLGRQLYVLCWNFSVFGKGIFHGNYFYFSSVISSRPS
jgi:hypothetical protein